MGDVVLGLLLEGITRFKPPARSVLERLRQVAEPPQGVSFHTEDGAAYTGLVVLDANRIAVLLAARTEPTLGSRPKRPHLTASPPVSGQPYTESRRSFDDPDEPDEHEWDEPPGYGRYK